MLSSDQSLIGRIIAIIKIEKLEALQDGGMAQLLHLDDMLSDLVAMEGEAVGVVQMMPPEKEDSAATQQGCSIPPHCEPSQPTRSPATPTTDIPRHSLDMDRDIHSHTNPSTENRDVHTFPSPAGKGNVMLARDLTTSALAKSPTPGFGGAPPGRVSLSSSMGDQVLRFNDVAALLPHREFKLHGGQISDVGSDLSYSSLCKQIDEGLHEGFTESEMIRTVIKITKPGTFREMLAKTLSLFYNFSQKIAHP